jgi:hypothetical protein
MVMYHPPKSQLWGHKVGRRRAADLVEKSFLFLREKCSTDVQKGAEFSVGWTPAKYPSITASVEALEAQLGGNGNAKDFPDRSGPPFRMQRSIISEIQLPLVAFWFDLMVEQIKQIQAVPNCYMLWHLQWKDEIPVFKAGLGWSGNTFGVNLGRPHRLTTTFSFRDISQYLAIKKYLADIDLVELSDNHIRPKGSIPLASRAKNE